MTQIQCTVYMEDSTPIIIMPIENNKTMFECFTFKDGHNEACVDYIKTLPKASEEITQKTLAQYQRHLNSLPIDKTEVINTPKMKIR